MRVIVVGAGIFGASTAFHLAEAGAQVVLIDPLRAGRATAAGAGIVCPWASSIRDADWLREAKAAAAALPTLTARLAAMGCGDGGYARVGGLVLGGAEGLDSAEALIRARADDLAGAVTRLTGAEARALFPPLAEGAGAVHVAGAARLDGRALAAALIAGAKALGAQMRAEAALALDFAGGRRGVRCASGLVEGDAVVLCAGIWAGALLAPLGLPSGVRLQRGQIVHLHLPGADTASWPVLLPRTSHYMLAFDAGRIVVGATREEGTGEDHRVTASGLAGVLAAGLAIAPGLADATVVETRIGFRPMPEAGEAPILGPAPGVPGLWIGNGLGHSGLTLGAEAGRRLAARVTSAA